MFHCRGTALLRHAGDCLKASGETALVLLANRSHLALLLKHLQAADSGWLQAAQLRACIEAGRMLSYATLVLKNKTPSIEVTSCLETVLSNALQHCVKSPHPQVRRLGLVILYNISMKLPKTAAKLLNVEHFLSAAIAEPDIEVRRDMASVMGDLVHLSEVRGCLRPTALQSDLAYLAVAAMDGAEQAWRVVHSSVTARHDERAAPTLCTANCLAKRHRGYL
jgi:hypothetical protein